MANFHQILSGFSYGELDPRLAARYDYAGYNRGVKTASNVLSIPQGGFARRFGTLYAATQTATNWKYSKLYAFVYDDLAVYNILFEDLSIKLYLENTLNATVVSTYPKEVIRQLRFVVVQDRLIILHQNYPPRQLVRSATAANAITGIDAANDYIAITNALVVGTIYPATFTTGGTLPVSDPQILVNTLYYVRAITTTAVRVYTTPTDASDNVNFYDITATGTGNLLTQDTWTLSNVAFSILPAYDFDAFATYSAAGFTFTASATSGTYGVPLTITASGAVFTAAHIGGLFIGNGGIVRIMTNPGTTTVTGYTYEDFINTTAFPGTEAFLGEPAWSAARGYPRCGTFFQQRLILGGSRSIPNGVWASTSFEAYDFDDSQKLDDNAISHYPAAGDNNYIKEMTSTKSLLVHSNTGNYSTPLTAETPLTPSNFTLTEQNSDGVSDVVPVDIDNQIIYVDKSARNVKSMAWDIVQSSYMNTNISLPSAHLVQTPSTMAVFSEPAYTDGYFLICVNDDGTLAIYNSLIEQEIKGWTKANTAQNATTGYFRDVVAGLNRAWVTVERTINGSTVLYIEELEFNVRTDCSKTYTDVGSATLTGLNHLEGQTVQIFADGVTLTDVEVSGGSITVEQVVTDAFVGLSYNPLIVPLPVNYQLQNGPALYQENHIRTIYVHYFESAGMTLQGYDIPIQQMQEVTLDEIVVPSSGIFEYTLMEGWNSFEYTIEISQSKPVPMTLLGIGYDVEVS